mmetsp:Transcript_1663/g.3906  ORF Transcript_1663/g.3906 Transcript_1663/m.3906 type:complete len:362 (-) Transcript_1663:227-1312(-)
MAPPLQPLPRYQSLQSEQQNQHLKEQHSIGMLGASTITKVYDPARYASSPPRKPSSTLQEPMTLRELQYEICTESHNGTSHLNMASKPNMHTKVSSSSWKTNTRGFSSEESKVYQERPILNVGIPPVAPEQSTEEELRNYWNAKFGKSKILLRRDEHLPHAPQRTVVRARVQSSESQAFEEWRAEKARQHQEELARQKSARQEAEESAIRTARENARAVKAWERKKRKEARQARAEARRALRAEHKQSQADNERREKVKKEIDARALQELKRASTQSVNNIAARRAALAQEKALRKEKQEKNSEAFEKWLASKRRQAVFSKRHKAEMESIRKEVTQAERERRWAKKDVVLAYTNMAKEGRT